MAISFSPPFPPYGHLIGSLLRVRTAFQAKHLGLNINNQHIMLWHTCSSIQTFAHLFLCFVFVCFFWGGRGGTTLIYKTRKSQRSLASNHGSHVSTRVLHNNKPTTCFKHFAIKVSNEPKKKNTAVSRAFSLSGSLRKYKRKNSRQTRSFPSIYDDTPVPLPTQ